jgi:hypothetical protein
VKHGGDGVVADGNGGEALGPRRQGKQLHSKPQVHQKGACAEPVNQSPFQRWLRREEHLLRQARDHFNGCPS